MPLLITVYFSPLHLNLLSFTRQQLIFFYFPLCFLKFSNTFFFLATLPHLYLALLGLYSHLFVFALYLSSQPSHIFWPCIPLCAASIDLLSGWSAIDYSTCSSATELGCYCCAEILHINSPELTLISQTHHSTVFIFACFSCLQKIQQHVRCLLYVLLI